jgi:hypothetical protein
MPSTRRLPALGFKHEVEEGRRMSARIFNVLIGTWLFLSAFGWPHSPAQGMTALICGALTLLTALVSIFYPRVRYLTATIAVVLFVASLATASARYDLTFWHNAVFAIVIFLIALFDKGTIGARHRRDFRDELSQPIGGPNQSRM